MTRKHAFLVSVWVETVAGESLEPAWRGSIEHLKTRRRRYFRDTTELVRVLADWTRPQNRE
jgi:hypothetical protein